MRLWEERYTPAMLCCAKSTGVLEASSDSLSADPVRHRRDRERSMMLA
ncbi:hypothetical protein MPS_2493 [Mycobacterium pseudoshottsii JCM 15466]|nr:hypothetical protein MMSP_2403 [Mycobacterium sp. 012931]GAQ35224.1 hypothetical protein MPS_2493 [Mycobacterium pseudoshottsii JCM 15466]